MSARRARSIEALGLIVALWGVGRASVLYFSQQAPEDAKPAKRVATFSVSTLKTPMVMAVSSATVAISGAANSTISSRKAAFRKAAEAPQPIARSIAETRSLPVPFPAPAAAPQASSERAPATTDQPPAIGPDMPLKPALRPLHGAAWIVWRPDTTGRALSGGGQLGGSQIGARLFLPVAFKDRLRASLRAYAPLQQTKAFELSPGLSVRPFPRLPVELIAERRLRGGTKARDATSVFLAGGTSTQLLGGAWQAETYGQAGMVGLHSPQFFADGSATLRHAIGEGQAIGFGIWGGLQPGVKRLDVGPSATTMVGPSALKVRLTVDWRVRVGGDARPGSGVSVSVSKDF